MASGPAAAHAAIPSALLAAGIPEMPAPIVRAGSCAPDVAGETLGRMPEMDDVLLRIPTLRCPVPPLKGTPMLDVGGKRVTTPEDLHVFQPSYTLSKAPVVPLTAKNLKEVIAIVWGVNNNMTSFPRCRQHAFSDKLAEAKRIAVSLAGGEYTMDLILTTSIPAGVETFASGVVEAPSPSSSNAVHAFSCTLHPIIMYSKADNLIVLVVVPRFASLLPRVIIPEPGASHNFFTSIATATADSVEGACSPAIIHSALRVRSGLGDGAPSALQKLCGDNLGQFRRMPDFYAQGCSLRSAALVDGPVLTNTLMTLYSSFVDLTTSKMAFVVTGAIK